MSGVSGDGIGNPARQMPEPAPADADLAGWNAAIGNLLSDPAGAHGNGVASVAAEPGMAAALSGVVERAPGELVGLLAELSAPLQAVATPLTMDAGLLPATADLPDPVPAGVALSGNSGEAAAVGAATQAPVQAGFEATADSGLVGGNPLLGWALGSLLGGPGTVPLWTAMGITPQDLQDRLATAPWEVAAFQLGRAITARQYDALTALPGPLGALLRAGIDPQAALALQLGWEAVLQGGRNPFTGRDQPPLWQQWGLGSHGALQALAAALPGNGIALPDAGQRPSVLAQQLLGLAPQPASVTAGIPMGGWPQGIVAASTAALLALPGAGFAGFHPATAAELGTATAAVLVGSASGELLLVRSNPVLPDGNEPFAPGASSSIGALHEPSAAMPHDLAGGLRFADLLQLRLGLAGDTPIAVASWSLEAGVPPTALLPVLHTMLAAAPAQPQAADIWLPLYGPESAPRGSISLDTGAMLTFGLLSPAAFAPTAPHSALPLVSLRLRGTRTGGNPAAQVVHEIRRPVPIDLAPACLEVPLWRIDDTRVLVEVGPTGPHAAARRAAALCQALTEARPDLALLQPGEGISTWAGSPLWLALAGIPKPLAMGVLPEAQPPRVEVLRSEAEWLVSHAGAGFPAPLRHLHARDAIESEALLLDVLYALPVLPETTRMDARGRLALDGFHAARAWAAAAALDDQPASLRAREAWSAVARDCAAAVAGGASDDTALNAAQAALDGTGPNAGSALDRPGFLTTTRQMLEGRGAALSRYGKHALAAVRTGAFAGIGPAERTAIAGCLGRLVGPRPGMHAPTAIGLQQRAGLTRIGASV